jgi:hypothetical protein
VQRTVTNTLNDYDYSLSSFLFPHSDAVGTSLVCNKTDMCSAYQRTQSCRVPSFRLGILRAPSRSKQIDLRGSLRTSPVSKQRTFFRIILNLRTKKSFKTSFVK